MKKLIMVLCVVIMFFGIVGCPSSDDPATMSSSSSYTSKVATSDPGTGAVPVDPIGDEPSPSPTPEPATLILLGSGLIGLAGIGRKKLFKKD